MHNDYLAFCRIYLFSIFEECHFYVFYLCSIQKRIPQCFRTSFRDGYYLYLQTFSLIIIITKLIEEKESTWNDLSRFTDLMSTLFIRNKAKDETVTQKQRSNRRMRYDLNLKSLITIFLPDYFLLPGVEIAQSQTNGKKPWGTIEMRKNSN